MSHIEQLFWLLAAFTVVFGAVWLRPSGVLFVSQLGWRYRPCWLSSGLAFRNESGGLMLGNLLPTGSSVVAAPWPLSISPSGVAAYSPSSPTPDGRPVQSGRYVAFSQLQSTGNDGKTLLVNGRPFVVTQSKTLALRWSRWLAELRNLPEEKRGQWIESALAASCDLEEARTAIQAARRRTRWVRRLSTLLFAYCFGTLGLAAFGGAAIPLLFAAELYLALALTTYLVFNWASRTAGPDEPALHRDWMILISPVDAFHASDQIIRPALEMFHPFVLSRILAREAAFAEIERRVALDVLYPLPAENGFSPRAAETAQWFSERLRNAIWSAFRTMGLDPNRHDVPPAPHDSLSRSYCPRCAGQYAMESGSCSACGVKLRSFAESPPATKGPGDAPIPAGPILPIANPAGAAAALASPVADAKTQPTQRRPKRKRR